MYNSWIKSNHWVAIAKEKGFVWKTHLFFGNKKILFSYHLNSDGWMEIAGIVFPRL